MKVRNKPVDCDAVQFTGDNQAEVEAFCARHGYTLEFQEQYNQMLIHTGAGSLTAKRFFYFIADPMDMVTVMSDTAFHQSFEIVDADADS